MENKEEINDEINLLDYINVLNKHKKLILIIVAISVLGAVIFSLRLPPIYEARSLIVPATQQMHERGISLFAAEFGISLPTPPNFAELMGLLKSNILMEKVIERYNLLPVLIEKDFKKDSIKKEGPIDKINKIKENGIIYLKDIFNVRETRQEIDKMWIGIRSLQDIFNVKHNQREGLIELTVRYKDPQKAADILNYILTELTDYMSGEAKRVAETNKKYLESLIDKNSDPLIKQKIYSLIAQQIETSMMAEVKENLAFKVIDPPKVPDKRIGPNRRRNVMLSFVVSLFAGVFIAFFMEYVEKVKGKKL